MDVMDAKQRDVYYRKWCRWLVRIEADVNALLLNRAIAQGVQDILRANTALPPSRFVGWMSAAYGRAQASGVRRHAVADRYGRDYSLAALLVDIRDHPEVLSRQRFKRKYANKTIFVKATADADFDDLVGPGCDHPSASRVERDLVRLRVRARKIKRYVDTHVAHYDRRRLRIPPSFDELDEALDFLGELCRRYHYLMFAIDRVPFEANIIDHWTAIFELPWIEI